MSRSFSLKIKDHLHAADRKRVYNEQLFTEVAPRYDFITRMLSFGQDYAWKRKLIAALPDVEAPICLDLACGTGDITFLLAERYPEGRVIGVDLTPGMLALAEQLNQAKQVTFALGDMAKLAADTASVDIVTGGYALRNAPDLVEALNEIHRVLKPGGQAVFLDFSKSPNRFSQAVSYHLLKFWGGLWGLLVHRNAEVYGYIAESLKAYPDRECLRELCAEHGLSTEQSRLFFGGMLELRVLRKNP